jgi:hypothetical protein
MVDPHPDYLSRLYSGPGAEEWLRYAKFRTDPTHEMIDTAKNFIVDRQDKPIQGPVDMVVLGGGNLTHESPVIREILEMWNGRLMLVDFSEDLLRQAAQNAKQLSAIEVSLLCIDLRRADAAKMIRNSRGSWNKVIVIGLGFIVANLTTRVALPLLADFLRSGDEALIDVCARLHPEAVEPADLARLEDAVQEPEFAIFLNAPTRFSRSELEVKVTNGEGNSLIAEYSVAGDADSTNRIPALHIQLVDVSQFIDACDRLGIVARILGFRSGGKFADIVLLRR